jgi:hypothetical protein
MSIGMMAGLGGGLTLGAASPNCACQGYNPLLYPPDPCCGGNGNGCGGNGSGGDTGIGPLGIAPPGSGNEGSGGGGNGGGGGGNCCSNGGGPFVGPTSGGGSCGNGGGGSCGNGDTPQDGGCGCGGNGNGGNGGGNGGGDGGPQLCLDSTYGGGRGSIPTPRGNIRNGARLMPLSPAPPSQSPPQQPCSNPSGTAPAAVPGPGSSFSQAIQVDSSVAPVKFLPVTCAETGATLTSQDCSVVTFYLNDSTLKHYSTPGGTGLECVVHAQPKQFSGGSVQGTPGGTLTITVTG